MWSCGSAAGPGLLLSGGERLALCILTRLRWTAVMIAVMLAIAVWLWFRLTRVDPSRDPESVMRPTLCDPQRLKAVLHAFTGGGTGPPVPPCTGAASPRRSERHRTEALCRTLLERMLGYPLVKCRPSFLRNPVTNRCLELDMYNEEHRIGFEYDGAQHDVYTPHFHVNRDHFEYRRLLDQLKDKLCVEHGIRLLRINWESVRVSEPVVTAQYLERLLTENGIGFRSVLLLEPVGATAPPSPEAPASRYTRH